MSQIVHYKMNDDATDASGNGNHGTPVNMAYAAGKIGQAGSFGALAKINCPSALIPASDWSISCWVNPTSFAAHRYPWGQSDGSGGSTMLLRIAITTGLLAVYIGAYRSTRAVVAGVWTFVGATYDAGKNLRVFVDSDQYYFAALGVDIAAPVATAVGAYGGNANGGYLGLIDSFRIYSPALTISEMLSIRASGNGTELATPWVAAKRRRTLLGAC